MANLLASLGREITPDLFKKTFALFADSALRPAADICTVKRNIAYGAHDKQRLDIFQPVIRQSEKLRTLVFVHGGGFKHGDKGEADAPFYNNIGSWAAANGLLGITMSYRLAPEYQWPSGSQDVAAALRWLTANIAEFGGDPHQIYLVGQSAGAVHVAGYVADDTIRQGQIPAAGAVMISGIYDLTRFPRNPFEDAYYGTDPSVMASRSTLNGLVISQISCLYVIAELDPPGFQAQANLLIAAHQGRLGKWPRFFYASGHNHLSTVYSLGREPNRLGECIIEFCLDSEPGPLQSLSQ